MCVTDGQLKNEIGGPNIVLSPPEKVLEAMDDERKKKFKESGLLEICEKGLYNVQEAEV